MFLFDGIFWVFFLGTFVFFYSNFNFSRVSYAYSRVLLIWVFGASFD